MDRRRFEKLRRGRLDPEARIDLHGMTSEHAHAALTGFILAAHAEGLRLVLVITGKGRPDAQAMQPHRHGILRHSVPHWLAAPPLSARILQVAPAHQRHGGAGAFYVYLRRQRPEGYQARHRGFGVREEELLAVDLVGWRSPPGPPASQPVDERLARLGLHVRVLLRVHQDHPVRVEERRVALEEDLEVAACSRS